MHHHHGHTEANDTSNIKVAFLLNIAFTIIEIIGGFLTNSVAIFSDAVHDLGDSLSLGLAWYFQKVSQKDRDQKFTYGYKRYSVLGALINTVVLIIGCVFILWETIPRLYHPEEVEPVGMIILASLGILVNGAAVLKLKKGHSLNERVVALHLLEDVLGWVAVLIGSIILLFWDMPIIDPILSLLITCFILFNIYRNLKSSLGVIMQRTPSNINLSDIESYFTEKEIISEVTDIHVWSLDGNYNVMTINIVLKNAMTTDELAPQLDEMHQELLKFNVHHSTIEIVS